MLRKAGKLTAILMAGLMTVSPLTEVAAFADELEIVTDETIQTEDVLTTDDPETGDTVEMEMTTEDGSVVTNSFEAEETADDELINSGSDDVVMPGVDEDADAVSGAGQDDLEADTAVLPTNGRVLRLVSAGTGIKAGQHIYFGHKDTSMGYEDSEHGNLPYWRVLHPSQANNKNQPKDGEKGYMFVMSEALWGNSTDDEHYPGNCEFNTLSENTWQGSKVQDYCSRVYKGFYTKEKVAVAGFTKTDMNFDSWYKSELKNDKDKVFLLSAKEMYDYVSSTEWPDSDDSRSAKYKGKACKYWLRSPGEKSETSAYAAAVYGGGNVVSLRVGDTSKCAIRPAFNIDLSKVLFTSDADGGKPKGTMGTLSPVAKKDVYDWKLTLIDEDESRKNFKADIGGSTTVKVRAGQSVKITFSGSKGDASDQVSAILCDTTGSDIKYYGKLAEKKSSGEANLTMPSDLSDGTYRLMVFSEQRSVGEDGKDDKYVDYASKTSDITVVVENPKSKLPQTITASNFTKKVGDAAFNIGAKTNGDGKLTYSSSDQKVAKVDASGEVTIVGPGTAKITINAAATEKYKAATKTISIVVKPASVVKKDITKATVTGIKNRKYSGKRIAQKPVVKIGNKTLVRGTDYGVKYITKDRINVGKVDIQIIGKGDYSGAINKSFKIIKAKNKIKVSGKKVNIKASKLASKKKTLKAKDVIKVEKAIGKVTYEKLSGNKKITVASNGKVTVKKGLEAGNYKVKVKVKAKGDKNHNAKARKVTFTIVVK